MKFKLAHLIGVLTPIMADSLIKKKKKVLLNPSSNTFIDFIMGM